MNPKYLTDLDQLRIEMMECEPFERTEDIDHEEISSDIHDELNPYEDDTDVD